MKYFKLFENFLNEAKIEYSLKDLMDDNKNEKDYTAMCEFIARTLGVDPKKIEVVSSEDDGFDHYETLYKKNNFVPLNNPSSETSTFYSKEANVIMSNDGSAVAYFVPQG
jgi:hypothetical protein